MGGVGLNPCLLWRQLSRLGIVDNRPPTLELSGPALLFVNKASTPHITGDHNQYFLLLSKNCLQLGPVCRQGPRIKLSQAPGAKSAAFNQVLCLQPSPQSATNSSACSQVLSLQPSPLPAPKSSACTQVLSLQPSPLLATKSSACTQVLCLQPSPLLQLSLLPTSPLSPAATSDSSQGN